MVEFAARPYVNNQGICIFDQMKCCSDIVKSANQSE